MTVGVKDEYRRRGVGTKLLQWALAAAERDPSIGAVFLHVITYNDAAIEFYRRNGFEYIRTHEHFYHIRGKDYGCHVYAKAMHDATLSRTPRGLLTWLLDALSSLGGSIFSALASSDEQGAERDAVPVVPDSMV
eukprot:scaffold657_cov245-Pinguiococcus_pyrenoidosus.AAC.12